MPLILALLALAPQIVQSPELCVNLWCWADFSAGGRRNFDSPGPASPAFVTLAKSPAQPIFDAA